MVECGVRQCFPCRDVLSDSISQWYDKSLHAGISVKFESTSEKHLRLTQISLRTAARTMIHLVKFVSLGSDVIHQNLVGRELELDGCPADQSEVSILCWSGPITAHLVYSVFLSRTPLLSSWMTWTQRRAWQHTSGQWIFCGNILVKYWCPHPVLHVQLAELAVCLDLAVAAGHLLHEGAQLHGLGDQGAAHGAVVGVRLGGEGEVVPGQGEDVMEMLDGWWQMWKSYCVILF